MYLCQFTVLLIVGTDKLSGRLLQLITYALCLTAKKKPLFTPTCEGLLISQNMTSVALRQRQNQHDCVMVLLNILERRTTIHILIRTIRESWCSLTATKLLLNPLLQNMFLYLNTVKHCK